MSRRHKNTKEYRETPRKCSVCSQWISEELIAEKKRQHSINIKKALKESDLKVGRPRKHSYEEIIRLRNEKRSFREISHALKCSIASVQRAVNLNKKEST